MKQARPGAQKAHLGRVRDELRPLASMTVSELRARYAEVFGEPSHSRNKPYLVKKLARKLQERAEGGLSPRARARAAELAPRALARLHDGLAERQALATGTPPRDPRCPPVGAVLRRDYRGTTHEVRVVEGGFELRGERYGSLSSVAKAITGTGWNGYTFFRRALEAVAAEA
ncbi:MAG TPA: DUF2924 domain-containing protein [Polyangiaceae bacterium]|nr:DUF2924 domain-containing protein [Polyangiaceae bacterium]